MPGRLWVAVVLLGVPVAWLGWNIVVAPELPPVIWLGIAIAFLVQLRRGHPLARQWGFLVAGFMLFFGATYFLSAGAVFLLSALTRPMHALVGLLLLASGAFLWWSLSGRAVRRYFGLCCPSCRSYRTRPRSFLYNRIGCRICGREWKLRDPDPVESVFD